MGGLVDLAGRRCPYLRYHGLVRGFEDRARRYGYSMRDLSVLEPFPVPEHR